MTSEDAAELLNISRNDGSEPPSVSPAVLAHAYLRILGSLPRDRLRFESSAWPSRDATWSGPLAQSSLR